MFLSHLSNTQKKVFLGFFKKLIITDGDVDKAEEAYLRSVCAEMAIKDNDEIVINEKELSTTFPEIEQRRIVLIELIGAAMANKEYHTHEKAFIENIANLFEMNSEISQIQKIIIDFLKLQADFINFINSTLIKSKKEK